LRKRLKQGKYELIEVNDGQVCPKCGAYKTTPIGYCCNGHYVREWITAKEFERREING
jgi:uncharacterized OB-fold protein